MPSRTLFAALAGIVAVQGMAISQPQQLSRSNVTLAKRYSVDDAVALIYWYSEPGCTGKSNTYAVQGFSDGSFDYDPDTCDVGPPLYNIGNDLYNLEYRPRSFKVHTSGVSTYVPLNGLDYVIADAFPFAISPTSDTDDICSKNNGYLAGVKFYMDCTRKSGVKYDANLYCPGSCKQSGWSHADGYGVCTEVGDYWNTGEMNYAIDPQNIKNCKDGQVN